MSLPQPPITQPWHGFHCSKCGDRSPANIHISRRGYWCRECLAKEPFGPELLAVLDSAVAQELAQNPDPERKTS